MNKPKTVVIAPSVLESLEKEMSPEELQQFLDEIKDAFLNGDLFEKSEPVDLDKLREEEPEVYEQLMKSYEEPYIQQKLH